MSDEPTYVCEDCGIPTFVIGHWDGLKVCGVCRFIRTVPDMDEGTKRMLRHDDRAEEEGLILPKGGDDDAGSR